MTPTKTTLRNWNNENAVTYLWVCGVGCPTGQGFHHDPDGDGDDDCDFDEFDLLDRLLDLEGTVVDGQWCWDGEGDVRDARHNTIYNVKASC